MCVLSPQRILELITELAIFERAPTEVTNTAEQLLEDGWGPHPRFIAFMAHTATSPSIAVGFALCYFSYSTWKGTCLYLEDLYVQQSCRGSGVGLALIHRCVAEAQARGCKRVQWQALDWNAPALAFYEKMGAAELREWITLRLDAQAIEAFLAKHKPVYNSLQ